MTILEHILQMKLGVLDGAFDGWADARTVGKRCKHSVALILKAQQMLVSQVQVPSVILEDMMRNFKILLRMRLRGRVTT